MPGHLRADASDPADVPRILQGAGAVIIAAGGRVGVGLGGWAGYGQDIRLARGIADQARRLGVGKIVHVSVFHPPLLRKVSYVQAHELAAAHLIGSGVPTTIVRPTGFFSAFVAMLALGRKGRVPCIGDGAARTNPIHEADLAEVICDALDPAAAEGIDVGGPEIFTRQAICELVQAASGSRGIRHLAPGLVDLGSRGIRLLHPRLGQFLQFVAAMGPLDLVAPPHGRRRLGQTLSDCAKTD
jgi:uncharacterized protein YbjT (DUF2867 family)